MPTTEPTWVSRVCSAARAMPKSVSFTVIASVSISAVSAAGPPITIRLPGLTSRWMIPWRWAYSSPAHDWTPISTATCGPSAPLRLQELRAGLALDVLHDDVVAAVVDAGVVDLDDVRVDQLRDGERLAAEAGDELLVVGEVLGQDLDRDLALEHGVGRLEDRVDMPPGAEPLAELVAV